MLININSLDNFDNTTKYIYNQYSNNNQIFYLFSQIIDLKSIPIELLCKYYVRIYTLNSNFNQDINKHLLEGKLNIFENYIKILYEGIKLEILKTTEEKYLYHLTKFNNEEIIKIKNNLENKKDNLPLILFSKQFLSFFKKKEEIKKYIKINDENQILVLFEFENNIKFYSNYQTYFDIEEICLNKKEVIFLPFSCFEIKNIREIEINKIKLIQINLKYLDENKYKYLKDYKQKDEIIPFSIFKNELLNYNLISNHKIKTMIPKNIIDEIKNFKKKNKKNLNYISCIYSINKEQTYTNFK